RCCSFFFQAEDGIRDFHVTGVQTCALPIGKDARKMDPFIQYGMVAGIQAIRDAGLEVSEANASRIGVSIGSGIGGIGTIEEGTLVVEHKGPRRMSPFFVPSAIINMISGNLSIMYGMRG